MSRVIAPEYFYQVGGTLSAEAPSYVQRQADQELLAHAAAGDFCYVLTPRQMGKSSLIAHTVKQLKKKRIRSVVIDLQDKTQQDMSAEAFYAGLLADCIDQLQLPVELTQWWQEQALLSAVQRFGHFLTHEVLPRVPGRLVIFIDEIDATLSLDFSDDFFAALRALYNARARNAACKRLTVILVGVASPSDLVKDRGRSPFNIGHGIDLTDFSLQEARKFTAGLRPDGATAERCLQHILYWTGGHPYLTQKVCADLATKEPEHREKQHVDALVQTLFLADTTLGDSHLSHVRDRMLEDKHNPEALLELYRRIRSGETVPDDERSLVHASLKLAGIVKVSSPSGMLLPRNRIYERVFDLAWVDAALQARAQHHVPQAVAPTPTPAVQQAGGAHAPLPVRFDMDRWKATVAQHLGDWQAHLNHGKPSSLYTVLAAIALRPLVQAAQQEGMLAVALLLGNVVAGPGGYLLAEQIQGWCDRAETPSQAEIVTWLQEHVATQSALQQTLDVILERVEAIPQAQQGLQEADRPWFVATLRTELAQQGHLARFVTQLSGSGALAAGPGAVAAGQGGVAVGGDVYGNIYTGVPSHHPHEALAMYHRVLFNSHRHVSLRGLDPGASDPTGMPQRFDLTQVYVDLLTTTRVPARRTTTPRRRQPEPLEERETRPLGALEAVVAHRRLVLLGDPGSGKSTFLTYLALCLAAHHLEPEQDWLARLRVWPWREADVVPVLVVLRDFAQWFPREVKKAEASHVWQFIEARLKAQNLGFVASALHDCLDREGRAMVFLDGLDEIPTPKQRLVVRDAVAAFAQRYPQCRIVVTCRTLSYQDQAWKLADFDSCTLAAFSEEQIDRFITAWYGELARLGSVKTTAIDSAAQHLQAAVRRSDLRRLAGNPLLLTVMALVHTHKGRLPEARALLYEETIDILLWRWEQLKSDDTEAVPLLQHLLTQVQRTDVDLKRVLWQLAFEAHRTGGTTDSETVADIGEAQLRQALSALHPTQSYDWAYEVMQVMQVRAGLLLERAPGVYAFPHRTFQEYLAGAYLSTQADFASQAAHLAATGPLWREVILLAVGRLVYLHGETAKPLALVAELCPAPAPGTAVAWQQAWLAGDVLLEMGRNRINDTMLGQELGERVSQRLVRLLRAGQLSAVERAAAGNTLARLGDPRFQADAWYLPDEPLLGFVEIPAGTFRMGSTARDRLAYDDEKPRHTLPRYYMARYPVTVAQWQAFIDASGYQHADPRSLQGLPTHPVVYVNWHDALAYCAWLTERLRQWAGTPEPLAILLRSEHWQVTLPSEAEWEKAARGVDGRQYPWGKTADPQRANYTDTGIGITSVVGCFPGGASSYGVEELSGNVLEWTRSLWWPDGAKPAFGYPYTPEDGRENLQAADSIYRVLRGGGFWAGPRSVRCACRGRLDACDFGSNVGFRVLVRL